MKSSSVDYVSDFIGLFFCVYNIVFIFLYIGDINRSKFEKMILGNVYVGVLFLRDKVYCFKKENII